MRLRGNMNVEAILALQKTHLTDHKIGKEFGISRQAVYQFRKNNNISPVLNKNLDRNTEIINRFKNGESGTKIAFSLDMSVSQTYRIITKELNSVKTEDKNNSGSFGSDDVQNHERVKSESNSVSASDESIESKGDNE